MDDRGHCAVGNGANAVSAASSLRHGAATAAAAAARQISRRDGRGDMLGVSLANVDTCRSRCHEATAVVELGGGFHGHVKQFENLVPW